MSEPVITTLCYIEYSGHYLMLLRNKKSVDPNKGKWVGIGGKKEPGESPDDCMLREVREETGITLSSYHFHGVVNFISDVWTDEKMYLYTACLEPKDVLAGETEDPLKYLPECPEGELKWVPKRDVLSLNLWEGDRYFLNELLAGKDWQEMTLEYRGDELVRRLM